MLYVREVCENGIPQSPKNSQAHHRSPQNSARAVDCLCSRNLSAYSIVLTDLAALLVPAIVLVTEVAEEALVAALFFASRSLGCDHWWIGRVVRETL